MGEFIPGGYDVVMKSLSSVARPWRGMPLIIPSGGGTPRDVGVPVRRSSVIMGSGLPTILQRLREAAFETPVRGFLREGWMIAGHRPSVLG